MYGFQLFGNLAFSLPIMVSLFFCGVFLFVCSFVGFFFFFANYFVV